MKTLLFAFLSLFASIAFSKTLIVSDIDDTIKVSHVRDTSDVVMNAYVTTAPFKGMSEVYTEFLKENPDSEIIYVTNANSFLMKSSHTDFIKNNKFPNGKIFFSSTNVNVHKYNTIKSHLEKNSYDVLIMIGDNGERDIEFYSKIQKEFEHKISIKTYIRVAYSAPMEVQKLTPYQLGFVSPLEILADLTFNNFFSKDKYFDLAEKLATEIINEKRAAPKKPHYFPPWLNCKSMEFFSYPELMSAQIEKAYQKMELLCQ